MNTIQNLFQQAQLAEAAYADFTNFLNNPAGALTNPDLGGKFSQTQAATFAARYQVVSQYSVPGVSFMDGGFSATLFKDITTGTYTFAVRGTVGASDLSTDLGDVVADGIAIEQVIDMYNYWQSLTHLGVYQAAYLDTLTAETLQLETLWAQTLLPGGLDIYNNYVAQLHSAGFIVNMGPLGPSAQQVLFGNSDTVLVNTPLEWGSNTLSGATTVDVTGHSLGGHLAMAFSRLFPSATADVVAVNGAGFNFANGNVDILFAKLGGVLGFDAGTITNAVGTAGTYLTSQDWLFLQQPAGRTDIYTESGGLAQTLGHGKEQMTDSLAVYNLFAQLDPTLNTAPNSLQTITDILKASSNVANRSLENSLDALRTLFEQNYAGSNSNLFAAPTTTDDREAYYANLQTLQGYLDTTSFTTFNMQSLAGKSAAELESLAQNDISVRYALYKLNPFAVSGASALYDQINTDHALDLYDPATGTGTLSQEWLGDRAAMLANELLANTNDSVINGAGYVQSNGVLQHFQDDSSTIPIQVFVAPSTSGYTNDDIQQIIFGSSQNDTLTGYAKDDHLYGGAGDDTLTGGAGNDYLEGGIGNDTYIYHNGDGFDHILDTDHVGNIQYDDVNLTGGTLIAGGSYRSADGKFNYNFISGDATSGGTLLVNSDIEIENFSNGDFGITLGASNQQLPAKILSNVALDNQLDGHIYGAGVSEQIFGDPAQWTEIIGGGGSDIIYGGSSSDTIYGDIQSAQPENFGFRVDGFYYYYYEYSDVNTGLPISATGEYLDPGYEAWQGYNEPAIQYSLATYSDALQFYLGANESTDLSTFYNDTIYGGDGNDWIFGGAGSDVIYGENGNDRIYGYGSGIAGKDYFPTNLNWGNADIALFGEDIGNYLDGGNGDDEIQGGVGNDILVGGDGNDGLYCGWESSNNIFIGGTGDDRIIAGRNAVIIYNAGDGRDFLYPGDGNVLRLGAGIAANDITISRGGIDGDYADPNALVLGIKGTADQVSIGGWGESGYSHIVLVEFDDGTVWDATQLQSLISANAVIGTEGSDNLQAWAGSNDNLQGLGGDDTLVGNSGNDTLDGGTGNDYLSGSTGGDTYMFNPGGGQDTISENDPTAGNVDTIRFGAGIVASDIVFTLSGMDLVLGINGTTDQVTIQGWGYGEASRIERVEFAGGAVWDAATIAAMVNPAPVNNAPTGLATATLGNGTEDTAYTVSTASLLAGFSDVDGDTLSVSDLTSNNGSITDNGDGTFTITPTANFNGAVSLSYNVIDGNGGTIAASQSYSVDSVNDAPTGSATATATATLGNGTEDTGYTVSADDLLAGFSDVDGDALSVSALTSSNGSIVNNGDGTFTITPTANFNGAVNLSYNVIDGNGGSIAASQSYSLAAVNDAPTGSVNVSGIATQNETLTASNTLADADGLGTITYQWQSSVDGMTWSNIAGATADTFTLTEAQVGNYVLVNASYTDGHGTAESVSSVATAAVVNVNDAPTGTMTITGTATQNQVLIAANTLADADGLGTISYQWKANGVNIAGATASTLTLAEAQVGQTITVAASYTDLHGTAESVSSTATKAVVNVNDAPVLASAVADQAATQDALFSFTIPDGTFIDADTIHGDSLNYVATLADGNALPSWLTFDVATQTFSGTPGNTDVGNLNLLVTATDSGGLSASSNFALNVNDTSAGYSITYDGSGNSTTVYYDANGIKLSDSWTQADGRTGTDTFNGDGSIESHVTSIYADVSTYSTTVSDPDGSYQWSWSNSAGTSSGTIDYNAVTGEVIGSIAAAGAGYSYTYTYDNTQLGAGVTESQVTYTYADGSTYSTDSVSNPNGSYRRSWSDSAGSSGSTDYNAVTGEVIGSNTTVGAGYSCTYDNTQLGAGVTESKTTYTYADGSTYSTDTVSDPDGSYQWSWSNSDGSSGSTDYNAVTGEVIGSDATAGAGYSDTYDNTQNVGGISGVTESKYDYTYADGSTYSIDTVSNPNGSYQRSWSKSDGSTGTTDYNAATGEVIGATAGAGYSYTYDITQNVGGVSGVTKSKYDYTYADGSTYSIDAVSNPDWSYFQAWSKSDGTAGSSAVNASGTLIGDSVVNADGSQGVDAGGNHLMMGRAGIDALATATGNELIIGGIGNDTFTTGSGTYIIAFNKGDGQDVVNAVSGQNNTISLGGNFAYSDLALQKNGDDLVLDVGTSDSITFKNWYAGAQNIVDLQVIASSMSDFAPGSTNVLSNSNVENFDFQSLVSAFDQAQAANPTLTAWGITDSLLSAHLASSDTAALGGDLAYAYGTNGNLTGFGVSAAESTLSSSQFATAPQTLNPWPTLNTGTAQIK